MPIAMSMASRMSIYTMARCRTHPLNTKTPSTTMGMIMRMILPILMATIFFRLRIWV